MHPEVIRIEKMEKNDFRKIMRTQRLPEDALAPAAHVLHVSAERKGALRTPLRLRDLTDLYKSPMGNVLEVFSPPLRPVLHAVRPFVAVDPPCTLGS